jgi:hypothetical protein
MGYSWLTNINIELIVNILSFIYISSKLDILNHLIGLLIYIFSLNIFYVLLLFFFFFFGLFTINNKVNLHYSCSLYATVCGFQYKNISTGRRFIVIGSIYKL